MASIKNGVTRAQQNKAIRKEALRDQLSSQGHVQHVNDIANKLLGLEDELDQVQVQRLKAAADIKLKLISKYLPDLKSVEKTKETDLSNIPDDEIRKMMDDYIKEKS
ncbi:MAG: hypothetical protein ACC707_01670 [Thiohalomonadales bacterium]